MKFRCERDVLVEALGTAGRAVSTRSGLPGLSGVQIQLVGNQFTVTGSDLDLTITNTLEVSGEADGEAVIPARLAADIVKALSPGAVEFATDSDSLRISAGRSEFSIRLISADEFPKLQELEEPPVELEADQFAQALKQIILAASSDDSRPILTGVLLAAEDAGLRLVATDSYRLAMKDIEGISLLSEGEQVLVPSRALGELHRILNHGDKVSLRLGEKEASFSVGGVTLTTRLIEGDFPNYRGLVPDHHPNTLTVNRVALLEALRRVKLMAPQEGTPVRIEMNEHGMELIAVTADVGNAREVVESSYVGDELVVAFNPRFLLEGLEVAPGDEVTLLTTDELKPALIRSVGYENYLYLLMPVRVS